MARAGSDPASLAGVTVRNRLKQCRKVARDLASDPSNDEHVHQLRVATRRADAALRLYAPHLPKRAVRRMRKRLRAVRRAAGNVRNLDVLLLRLDPADSPDNSAPAGQKQVIRQLRRCRKREVRQLLDRLPRLLDKRYRRLSRRFLRHLEDAGRHSKRFQTDRLLQPITDQFARAATEDLSNIDNLHRFRICGKRVRYAVEILKGQIPRNRYNSVIESLKQLQESVGTINDHHTAIELLESVRSRCDAPNALEALNQLIAREQQLLASRHAAFLEWWQTAGSARREAIRNCTKLAAS
ncbi:CHAD domain-containing protein [Maioricimonas sp. JC845]|uniref:CHAD domain-containing protein n=1 Tax=Maioricimonas sp. JC845 TaxID=3232138 RepID=UPI0034576AE4